MKAYYYLCQLYEEQRDFENAIETCKKLIELQPHIADFHCRMAQYLYLTGNISESIEHYQTAVTINPKYSYAYYALALAYEKEKNIDAAIENYQKFLDLSDNNQLKSEIKAKINYLKSE